MDQEKVCIMLLVLTGTNCCKGSCEVTQITQWYRSEIGLAMTASEIHQKT